MSRAAEAPIPRGNPKRENRLTILHWNKCRIGQNDDKAKNRVEMKEEENVSPEMDWLLAEN